MDRERHTMMRHMLRAPQNSSITAPSSCSEAGEAWQRGKASQNLEAWQKGKASQNLAARQRGKASESLEELFGPEGTSCTGHGRMYHVIVLRRRAGM